MSALQGVRRAGHAPRRLVAARVDGVRGGDGRRPEGAQDVRVRARLLHRAVQRLGAAGRPGADPDGGVGARPRRRDRAIAVGLLPLAQLSLSRAGDLPRQRIGRARRQRRRSGRRWSATATFRWAGVDDHYFISAVLQPPGPARLEYSRGHAAGHVDGTPPQTAHYVAYAIRFPSAPEKVRFYVGPKQLDVHAQHRSGVHARDLLRDLRVARRAAARRPDAGCTDSSATGAGRSSS